MNNIINIHNLPLLSEWKVIIRDGSSRLDVAQKYGIIRVRYNQHDFLLISLNQNWRFAETPLEKIYTTGELYQNEEMLQQYFNELDLREKIYENWVYQIIGGGDYINSVQNLGYKYGQILTTTELTNALNNALEVEILSSRENKIPSIFSNDPDLIITETKTNKIDWQQVVRAIPSHLIKYRDTEHEYRTDTLEIVELCGKPVRIPIDGLQYWGSFNPSNEYHKILRDAYTLQ